MKIEQASRLAFTFGRMSVAEIKNKIVTKCFRLPTSLAKTVLKLKFCKWQSYRQQCEITDVKMNEIISDHHVFMFHLSK